MAASPFSPGMHDKEQKKAWSIKYNTKEQGWKRTLSSNVSESVFRDSGGGRGGFCNEILLYFYPLA